MGIEFKLSDRELPASPAFIRFLDAAISGRKREPEFWPDQLSEGLVREPVDEQGLVAEAASRVMCDAVGRERVTRAYTLFVALLTGDTDSLAAFQPRFHFISIVGIPRTGGSYLTAELYRSIGLDPHDVPGALAHDSFPEAGPFELARGFNSWVAVLKMTAEYLTMVELFFADRPRHSGKVVVPKKLTQAIYAAGLFRRVFGPESEYVLTVRHPVSACVSTYEKSGGLPENGQFRVRSNIERWCRRDLEHTGWDASRIETATYFEAYLRYWELYYLSVATVGLAPPAKLQIVPYGAVRMQMLGQSYHDRHGAGGQAAAFQATDRARRQHPDWVAKSRPALERVRSAWTAGGLTFPDEIDGCE